MATISTWANTVRPSFDHRLWWYRLQRRTLTWPGVFLESRSWWGHDCVKTKTTTYHIWPFYGASTSFFFGSNLSTSNSVITYEFTKFITWPAQFPAWSLKNFGYLSWKIPILKYTGKFSEEPHRAMKQADRQAGCWYCIMYKNLFSLILLGA